MKCECWLLDGYVGLELAPEGCREREYIVLEGRLGLDPVLKGAGGCEGTARVECRESELALVGLDE